MNSVSHLPTAEAAIPDVRKKVQAMIAAKEVTQGTVATESGVNATRLSQFINEKYPGDNSEVANALQRWINQRDVKAKQSQTLPSAPGFITTPTSNKCIDALTYAQIAGDIAIVYGGAGLGKTQSLRHYQGLENNVWIATMTPSSATVSAALEEIAISVGIKETTGRPARIRRDIITRITNTGGLLIIDEAQHLTTTALDEIRSIYDATEVGVALVGNEAVYSNMTGGRRASYLDRLFSRIGKRVKLTRVLKSDVVAIAHAWNITPKDAVETLVQIGLKPGGLRAVTKTLRLASMFAAGEGTSISDKHITSAWNELGGNS